MPALRDLVINTGPVLALVAAGHLEILRKLFAKTVVPHEVGQEIETGDARNSRARNFAPLPGSTNALQPRFSRRCFNPPWTSGKPRSSR